MEADPRSLVGKVGLIKGQLGIAAETPLPVAVDLAAKQLQLPLDAGLPLPQRAAACYDALFGVEQRAEQPDAPPAPPPPAPLKPTLPPISMTSEPSPMAAFRAKAESSSGPSAAHQCSSLSTLRTYLKTLGCAPLLAVLDARGAASFEPEQPTEWFGEHARMQLRPSGGCESRPAWVAWVAEAAAAPGAAAPGATAVRQVLLWAADAKATRRALLALQLERGGINVELSVTCAEEVPPDGL